MTLQNMTPTRRRTKPDRERARLRLANAVVTAREALGWSQTELGQHLDPIVPQKTISRIEQGEFTTMGTGPFSRVVGLGIGLIVELENAMGLEPGHLTQLAGYLPAAEPSVFVAVENDPELSEQGKAALLAAYRQLRRKPSANGGTAN